ncbi:MAG: DUF3150 domain-containing protein [Candidatus Methanoperedens sp.]|nr:DUF3150 domain-containing protein [Candidatus Methanoperedens sp.]
MNFKDGLLLSLNVGKWGGGKKLTPDDLGLTTDQVPEFMKLGRKLLIPEDERNAFTQIENNARNALERESFAFPLGGARFVPRSKILEVDVKLKTYEEAYMAAVESFMDRYQEIREKMLETYPEHRDKLEPFYPASHQIRRLFHFGWSVFEIGEAGGIQEGETVEAYERFKANLQTQFDKFLEDAVVDLRFQVQETCLRTAERIAKGEVVNGNSIKALHSMIDRFTTLNFVGDAKIEDQLNKLRDTLQTTDSASLKENDTLKNQLGVMAASIAKDAADISDVSEITGTYKRRIEMD